MTIKLIEPEHRCKECKIPLNFDSNYCLSDKEIEKKYGKEKWYSRRSSWEIDNKRQCWSCPKCFERYLVDNRGE